MFGEFIDVLCMLIYHRHNIILCLWYIHYVYAVVGRRIFFFKRVKQTQTTRSGDLMVHKCFPV